MPKSETTNVKAKRVAKAVKGPTSPHFPSKPYMRTLRDQSPTSAPTAAWSASDDELLLRMKLSGKKWVEISPLFPGKTSNACRKRHARLVTHAQVEWDEFKERDLAVEFVNAKVGFFKMIAGNLKLEWRQVEKKCLELGFKTLLEKGKRIPPPVPPLKFEQAPEAKLSPRTKSGPQLPPSSEPLSAKMVPDYELSNYDDDDEGDDGGIPQAKSLIVKEGLAVSQDEDEDWGICQDGGDGLDDDDILFSKRDGFRPERNEEVDYI